MALRMGRKAWISPPFPAGETAVTWKTIGQENATKPSLHLKTEKANASDVYTKTEVYSKITALETDIANAITIITG